MPVDPTSAEMFTAGDASDHVREARRRARQMLGAEAHTGGVDDWRRALISARDSIIVVSLLWLGLHGFGDPPFTPWLLIALAIGFAMLVGISTGRSTHAQVQYYLSELDRERREVRENPDGEREEVAALYAAKGFREPLLTTIVDTLVADDERLLKVMMEEELGLSIHHMNHPILVGLWNFFGAVIPALVLAVPVIWIPSDAVHWWMPIAGGVLLALVALVTHRTTGRSAPELLADNLVMASVTGGAVYLLSKWLSAFV